MSTNSDQVKKELQNIEIAIELDRGKNIVEVAEMFGVKIPFVKAIAEKTASLDLKTKTAKIRRFSEAEREVLVGRIESGESLEDIAAEAGVTGSTLRRWCKQCGVNVPRRLEQISLAEQKEIRELLEEQDLREIVRAYNISRDATEELREPAHSHLNAESLSYLFELLRELPSASSKKLCGIAKGAGLDIPESAVSSYRKRLQSLKII